MSVPIPRDKLIELINLSRQFHSINDNVINLIDYWCKTNHIKYDLNPQNQNDSHSIKGVPQRKQDGVNQYGVNMNIISMTTNVENFLNEIKATIPDDNIIYQNEFTRLVHDYININNLYSSDSKTQFFPDAKLRKLFHFEDEGIVIGMETLNELISKVLCVNF
jgi:chromatin remodeling complex protein RSC6